MRSHYVKGGSTTDVGIPLYSVIDVSHSETSEAVGDCSHPIDPTKERLYDTRVVWVSAIYEQFVRMLGAQNGVLEFLDDKSSCGTSRRCLSMWEVHLETPLTTTT